MKKFVGILSLFCIFVFTFAGCSANLEEVSDSGEEYGSLVINNDDSRALDISELKSATVTVSGYGKVDITKENVSITDGTGSIKIEGIPVGNNKVVSIQALNKSGAKIETVLIRNIVDIIKDTTSSCSVDWSTTALGNVYYELLKNQSYNISTLKSSTVQAYLPEDVHASLIDAAAIAKDIKAGTTTEDTSKYVLETGTVTLVSTISSDKVTIQVSDPVSSAVKSVTSGTNKITGVAPGTWKVYGTVNGTAVVYEASIEVQSGKTTEIGSVSLKTPAPRLEDSDGIGISKFITGETKVYLSSRTSDSEEEPDGVVIYYTTDGTTPTTASTKYTSGSAITVNDGSKISAVAVCSGLLDSDVSTWTFATPTLGYTHPSSGTYSPVSESTWASGTWELGANVADGNTTFALYSANATKILLEIYDAAYGKEALYDYWMEKGSDSVWRAKLSGDLTGKIYAFRCWGTELDVQ